MKKTQSLKLMLLGLMASVSTGAFAEVGDIFAYGGEDRTTQNANGILYYEEIADGVKLVGVQTVGTGNVIVIPTTVYNSWYGAAAEPLNVVEVEDNWYASTQIVLKKFNSDGTVAQQRPMSDPTLPLTDYNDLTLQIDAANLKTIGTDALQPLNKSIKKFVVSAGAGLTAIPDYAFINGSKSMPTDAEAIAKKEAEIAALKASIANSVECIVKEGKYNGTNEKYLGLQVYKLLFNSADVAVPADDPKYVILDETATPTAEGNKKNYPLYVIQTSGDVAPAGGAVARVNSKGQLVRTIGSTVTVVATPIAADGEECLVGEISKAGLLKKAQDALTALQTAQTNLMAYEQGTEKNLTKNRDEAKALYDAAVAMQQKMQTPAVANAWNNATTPVWNAIKAGDNSSLTNVAPSYNLDTYNTIYQALVDVDWPVNAQGKFIIDENDILHLNDAVETKYNNWQTEEQALQNSLTTVKKPLEDALDAAQKAYNEANENLTKAQNDLAAAEAALKALKDGEAKYTVEDENTTLAEVEFNNEKIKDFGEYAFYNCTGASFKNTAYTDQTSLPATTETIGDYAFANTGIDAGFYYSNANIKSIGDYAFANTNTQWVNLQNATQLTDETFGVHVFDNCPVKVIKLQNTQLTGMPVGLAENIKRTEPVTDCDGKYIGKPLSGSAGELQHYTIAGTDWTKEENLAKLYLANTTLETVDMPKGAKGIRDFGFAFCESLATITIPATVTAIGNYALAGTALQNLNLEHLTDLQTVGQGAFAYNTSMQYVYFAKTAPFDNLMGDVFKCDASLTTIKLNDDIKCLEAGLFAGTAVEKLDLSKTQLTVLEDLFQATETNVNSTFKYIKLPKPAYDWYTGVETRPGLQIIRDHALANLVEFVGWEYETGKYRFELPSSVWCMGTYVFYNDKKLTEFYAMDSKLTNLGVSTFNSCEKLEKVTMVTLNIIDPAWTSYGRTLPTALAGECYPEGLTFDGFQFNFDDMQFFGCKKPTVIVTEESKDNLKAYYRKSYPNEYSTLDVFHPTLTLGSFGGSAYSSTYYNYDYATWIPVDQATVYTAYQDLDKVYIYRAKHQNGFYKIPQATRPNFRFTSHEVEKADGTKEDVLDLWVNRGSDSWTWYPSVYQGSTTEGVFTPSVDNLGQKQILSALSSNYIFANDDVRRPQNSAAVIIISDKETIDIERHTKPLEVNQSTLDRDNELRITGTCFESGNDLPISKCVHAWYYNGNADDANFTKVNGTVPANQVVMHLSDFQGTAGSRIQVVFVDDDMSTGIKDYIQKNKLNEGAIYNMQGIRVKSTVKGQMYIQNGKKFIQK